MVISSCFFYGCPDEVQYSERAVHDCDLRGGELSCLNNFRGVCTAPVCSKLTASTSDGGSPEGVYCMADAGYYQPSDAGGNCIEVDENGNIISDAGM